MKKNRISELRQDILKKKIFYKSSNTEQNLFFKKFLKFPKIFMNKTFRTNNRHNFYHLNKKHKYFMVFNKRNKTKTVYYFQKIFVKKIYEKSVNAPCGLIPPKIKYYIIKIL